MQMTTAFWLTDNSLTFSWQISDDCMTAPWRLSNKWLATTWQMPDNYLTISWLFPDILKTYRRLQLMISSGIPCTRQQLATLVEQYTSMLHFYVNKLLKKWCSGVATYDNTWDSITLAPYKYVRCHVITLVDVNTWRTQLLSWETRHIHKRVLYNRSTCCSLRNPNNSEDISVSPKDYCTESLSPSKF